MDADAFRAAAHAMIDRIIDYRERIAREAPVRPTVAPGDIAAMLPDQAPESGEPWAHIDADIDRVVMPGVTHWASPGFFAYFPSNSSYESILGELLSAGLGVQGMLWQTSPACTELETVVMDWLGRAIGLPDVFLASGGVGGGVIQGTASEAVLCAMVAARARTGGADGLIAYTSSQAHSSIVKAAMVAGIGRDNVRLIDTDADRRMDPDALARAITEDRAAGRTPFFIAATLGTTGTGAIDPLDAIGRIAEEHGLWLHVDAAWAGAALVCPEHRSMLDGVERAHSFNFNPHKWLRTSFDCSALWVRDRRWLTDALSITPEYLRNAATDAGAVIDYRDWQIPLGRRFRALKLWFVLRSCGIDGLRAHIREGVRQAEVLAGLVGSDDRFDLVSRSLSLVCFRLRGDDAANRTLLDRVNATGEVFLTHTVAPVGGEDRFIIRMALGGMATTEDDVRRAWGLIARGVPG